MNKVIKIEGLDCANCARELEEELNKLDGVSATVDFMAQKVHVDCDESLLAKVKDCCNNFEEVRVGEIEIQVYGAGDTLITAESETVTSFVPEPVKQGNATINSVYKVRFTEGEKEVLHYVISSTGTGGYDNGTVTMLTALAIEDGAIKSVYKVAITANKSQSYIGTITHLDKYAGAAYTEGLEFTTGNGFVTSGATMSSTAINNAINGGIRYVELNLDTLNTPAEGGEENE